MKVHGYCAFCKSPKLFFDRRHLSLGHVFLALIVAICVNYFITLELSPSFLLIFAVNLIIGETCIQTRWRLFLICQKCGFDPVLYMKNKALACEKVKEKLADRKKDEIKKFIFPIKFADAKNLKELAT